MLSVNRFRYFIIVTTLLICHCADVNFSGNGGPKAAAPKPPVSSSIQPLDPVNDAHQCILDATGSNILAVTISGENCYPNQIDANGADRDDFFVTINGDLMRSGWQFFSNKDQDIKITYKLGSPGQTTQNVSLQIVDCDKVKQSNFDVSTGTGDGTTTLKAKRGDRFNIVATVTSGCYGRKDVYDMLDIKEKVFWIH
jgi:hypothetical protein